MSQARQSQATFSQMSMPDQYLVELENLWGMVSEMVEGGRLTKESSPEDYQKLVDQMVACNALYAEASSDNSPKQTEQETSPRWYLNHYRCDACDVEWDDQWDCACDDECPQCQRSLSPYLSEDVTEVASS